VELVDLVAQEAVIDDLKCSSKKQALQELSRIAAKQTGLHERAIFDVVLERERLGSTGVGDGIAIPHGRMAEINQITGLFARLKEPIEFDAVDGHPVDMVFLLLAPETAGADHLKALSRISRLLRDKRICEKLRGAVGADALYALIADQSSKAAA